MSLQTPEDKYDENDQEVAEALGLENEMEDLSEAKDEDAEEEKQQKIEDVGDDRSKVVWPEPPDVSVQAKRLVDEALEQG